MENKETKEVNFEMIDSEIVLAASDIIAHPSDDNKLLKEDAADEILQVTQEGRKYKTRLTKKYLERKPWHAPNPKEILSIIPGSVTSVAVKAGDKVAKGDKIMVYEAMKMQNVIVAPFSGVIKSVNVSEGEKLPKGYLLAEME